VTLGERLLLALSRDPDARDYGAAVQQWSLDNALDRLRWAFPDFDSRVRGRDVLDFGCGEGWQSLAMARLGAASVVGVDLNRTALDTGRRELARHPELEGRVTLAEAIPPQRRGGFDVVLSKDSMEHFGDPEGILREITAALRPDGRLLITFGPPWFAPYGSHMHFFTRVPWVQLWFSERTVLRVRGRFRHDGAQRYEDVESGLNRMSLAKFERLLERLNLRVEYRSYWCIRGINFLARLPLVRELAVTNVAVVLRRG
jgi:SAM-dependent methyltransferase